VVGDLVQDGLGHLAPQLSARAAQPLVGALEDADQGRSGAGAQPSSNRVGSPAPGGPL
jgi:hypothetical protein